MSYPPPPPYSEYNATNAKVQYQTGQSAYGNEFNIYKIIINQIILLFFKL